MKKWSKPSCVSMNTETLATYIEVAARSGICVAGDFR